MHEINTLADNNKRINVCHIVLSLDIGGLEKIVFKLCESADRSLINPSVICLDRIGVLGEELIKLNIHVKSMNRKGAFDIALINKLKKHFNENSIDVVHSHSGCMMYSTFAGRLSNVSAIIHTDHGRHYPEEKAVVVEEFISSFFINKIIAVSEELKTYLNRKLHFPKKKIGCIANGIDTEEFYAPTWKNELEIIKTELGISKDEFIIGTIGRVTPVKNQALLIRAFKDVLRDYNKCKLIIVGDGPEHADLKELTVDLNLSDNVLFLGERKDIPIILSVLDIFVLPSLSEGTSVTLLEALSTGVPVIASEVGGNPKIVIEEETGMLFESGNVKELSDKIMALIAGGPMTQEFTRKGRDLVIKDYSITEMNRKYLSLYRSYKAELSGA